MTFLLSSSPTCTWRENSLCQLLHTHSEDPAHTRTHKHGGNEESSWNLYNIHTPSHPCTITLSHHHTHTPSHYHTITLSHHHTHTPSHYHTITPIHHHTITPSCSYMQTCVTGTTLIPKVKTTSTALASRASPTCHMALHTPSRALVSWYWCWGFTADVL